MSNKSKPENVKENTINSRKKSFKDVHINNAYNEKMFNSNNKEDNIIRDFASQNPEWFHEKYNSNSKEKEKGLNDVNITEKETNRIKVSSSGITKEQIRLIQSKTKKIIPDKELENIFNNNSLDGTQKALFLKESKHNANKSICPNFMRNKFSQNIITLVIFISFFLNNIVPVFLTILYLFVNKSYNKLYKNNVLLNIIISIFSVSFFLYHHFF